MDKFKTSTQASNDIYIARNASDINIILINYNGHNYLEYDTIEYLYNKNKIRYYDISLHVSKWLKDGLETPKGKYEMD